MVEDAAGATERPSGPLRLQALLQLPRIADERGFAPISAIKALVAQLAEELPVSTEWIVPGAGYSPRSLYFHEVGVAQARDVMERFHYLRSPRLDGRAYGLSTQAGHLVAVCVSSPMDVPYLRDLLAVRGRPALLARSIARVFAFQGAPRNTISYLLSRVFRVEALLGVSDLITYVNPNLGFTGSSYRASGWQLVGDEPGTTYRYLDGRYATDRRFAAEFGLHEDRTYRRLLGDRFATNSMPLRPLLVFHSATSKSSRSTGNKGRAGTSRPNAPIISEQELGQ